MLIEFDTPKLKRLCETFQAGRRTWGDKVMRKIGQRLGELQAANNLEDLRNLAPGASPHPLKGKYAGLFAVSLHGAYRMIFKPTNDPEEYETADGMDRKRITAIKILKIEDYHG